MDRYVVVEGSGTSHCCFSYTVVDTTQPIMIGGEHYRGKYEGVCECFEEDVARRIAAALNTSRREGVAMDQKMNLLALGAILVIVGVTAWALPGHCAYCYPYACFDSTICGDGCFCAKIGGSMQGICASVD